METDDSIAANDIQNAVKESDATANSNAQEGGDSDSSSLSLDSDLVGVAALLDRVRESAVNRLAHGRQKLAPAPTELGDFELLSPIGRGGMGVVYEARQKTLDRIVAIKLLSKMMLPDGIAGKRVENGTGANQPGVRLAADERLVRRFHTEARAAARLSHPHIVPIFGFGEEGGYYFFVMQRIYGQALDQWLQDPESDEGNRFRRVAGYGRQAASALAYAHENNVLHRDVKPANLLLDENDHVLIADFGVARMGDADAMTRTNDVVGTLRYMSPEQLSGNATRQSDIYSLGVTLYELVSGKPALNDASVRQAALLQQPVRGPESLRQLCPNIPRDLQTIIEKSMRPLPEERYSSAAELEHDLKCFLEGRGISARRASLWERSRRWVRRNRTVSILAGTLILGLMTTIVVFAILQYQLTMAVNDIIAAKAATDRTVDVAASSMDEVFQRFASSSDVMMVEFDTQHFSAPTADRDTSAMLLRLLDFYDALAIRASAGPPPLSPRDAPNFRPRNADPLNPAQPAGQRSFPDQDATGQEATGQEATGQDATG
ncbi:MAG: serine/threonine-protein kinase, partial [Planctomycetota bacterium]